MPNGPERDDTAQPGVIRTAVSPGGGADGQARRAAPGRAHLFPALSRLGTDQSPDLSLPTALAIAPTSRDRSSREHRGKHSPSPGPVLSRRPGSGQHRRAAYRTRAAHRTEVGQHDRQSGNSRPPSAAGRRIVVAVPALPGRPEPESHPAAAGAQAHPPAGRGARQREPAVSGIPGELPGHAHRRGAAPARRRPADQPGRPAGRGHGDAARAAGR